MTLATRGAAADTAPDQVPGAADDPVLSLDILPSVVDAPLAPGIAVRGGSLADTRLLFEGFDLPYSFHLANARSIVSGSATDVQLVPGGFGVEYGRASSYVGISVPVGNDRAMQVDATALDGGALVRAPSAVWAFRQSWAHAVSSDVPDSSDFVAGYERALTPRWRFSTAVIGVLDKHELLQTQFMRLVVGLQYRDSRWRATAAASPMFARIGSLDQLALDARAEIIRHAPGAFGLADLDWRSGIETNNSRFEERSVVWTPDIGVWSAASARLDRHVRAVAGLRVDAFLRNTDLATQPRGAIEVRLPNRTSLYLVGAAYRRPAEQPDELRAVLHPERTTEISLGTTHAPDENIRIRGTLYYLTRSRLIVPQSDGSLANSGTGLAIGAELSASISRGPWFLQVGGSLSRATRTNSARGADHPSPFDQRVRINAFGAYRATQWQLGARFGLASGLLFTPIVGGIYDSDRDSYQPLFGLPLSERLPMRHHLDMRFDRAFWRRDFRLAVFVELRDIYAARVPLDYTYSFDYRERVAVGPLVPFWPFAGVRGTL